MIEDAVTRSRVVVLNLDDLQLLAKLAYARRNRIYRFCGFALVAIVALTILIDLVMNTDDIDWAAETLGLFAAALLLLLSSARVRASGWLLTSRKTLCMPHEFTITSGGLLVESARGKSEYYWSSFVKMVRERQRLFLFLAKRSAFIIPRRAFDSDADFESFLVSAEQCWERTHVL